MLPAANPLPAGNPLFPAYLGRLFALSILVAVTALIGLLFTRGDEQVAAIWLPSGMLLGFLLCSAQQHWMIYISATLATIFGIRIMAGDDYIFATAISIINVLEAWVAALLLLRLTKNQNGLGDLNNKSNLYWFAIICLVLVPVASGLMVATLRTMLVDHHFLTVLWHWTVAHSLGMAIATPIMLGFLRGDVAQLFNRHHIHRTAISLLSIILVTGLVFYQTRYPFLFFIPPVLIAVAANLGLGAVVLCMPVVALFALVATIAEHGPFALAVAASAHEKVFLAQIFILINFAMAAYVANTSSERRITARLLEEEHFKLKQSEKLLLSSESRFRMLSENSADMIFRLSENGMIGYASPAVRAGLGWDPEEMVGHFVKEFTHPDDLAINVSLTKTLQTTDTPVTDRLRGLHKDGRIIWLERTTRRILLDGKVVLLSNLRDVTDKKVAEDALAAANKKLELLATTDGLTGLSNRRMFDEALNQAWKQAARKNEGVSLLLIDVDRFKLYNDTYGHQSGDECLKSLALCLQGFARRPTDVAARYGGEELALLLPDCNEANALAIAEKLRQAIVDLQLPHTANSEAGGVVTVSIGIATALPQAQDQPGSEARLIKQADELLYEAKRTGRNKVMAASTLKDIPLTHTEQLREEQRLRKVAEYERLAKKCQDELDRIAYLAAKLLNTPIGLVTLVGRDHQTFAGKYGIEGEGTSRDVSFCAHVLNGSDPMIVRDATADARFENNELVTGGMSIRFYAGAPLVATDGQASAGAVCIIDTQTRAEFTPDQSKLLTVLAQLATKCIEGYNKATADQA